MAENKLTVFENEMFGTVRTVIEGDKVLFCGSDVAKALGYKNPSKALFDHCKGVTKCYTLTNGGTQEMNFIPEGDIYRLAARSDLPGADAFESWIFDDVLPSIRKHGAYMTEVTIDNIIANPDFGIKLLMELKEEQERRRKLEQENRMAQPKVEYFDDLVDRRLLTNFRDTAKELGIKERVFIRFLEEYGYIYRDTKKRIKPIAEYVRTGIFEIKDTKGTHNQWAGNQTLITPKGKSTFQLLLPKWMSRQEQHKTVK